MSSIRKEQPKGRRAPVVLQVLPSLEPGGSTRSAIDVARAVAEAGAGSLMASAGGPLARDLLRTGASAIELPLASRNPFLLRRAARRLARLIRAHKVDIVHARGPGASWAARRAAADAKAHFIATFDTVYDGAGAMQRRYLAAMARGERVIAVSQFLADHVHAVHGVEPGRIRLIRRGIDLAYFDPERVRPERLVQLSRRWSLPDGVPVVLAPVRRGGTGDFLLLEALARLSGLSFRCLLIGAAEEAAGRRDLERKIHELGLDQRVQFTGECADMPAAYMLADVVVSASSEPEAFLHVITEAQAMGRPVVTTTHGGVEEQVVRGRTAWVTPPGDPDALAAAIAEALSLTPEQRFALGQIAQAHAQENFAKERMCVQTLGVYRELLRADAYALGPAAA
jgi:glycosyltransferase involved in cell wall biosynthesis